MSRTAEEWGRVAVALPGWRWMPGMRWLMFRADGTLLASGRVPDNPAIGFNSKGRVLDPDDSATAGCFLALLGSGVRVWMDVDDGLWTVEVGGVRASMHATLGRACIAAAEALGRWPGGGA